MDLIWCEGAACAIGFEAALARWRDLAAGWLVGDQQCHWLTGDPPPAKQFWAGAYPATTLVETARQTARAAGYQIFDTQLLPPAAQWDTYYTPPKRPPRGAQEPSRRAGARRARAMIGDLERAIEIRAQYRVALWVCVPASLGRDDVGAPLDPLPRDASFRSPSPPPWRLEGRAGGRTRAVGPGVRAGQRHVHVRSASDAFLVTLLLVD